MNSTAPVTTSWTRIMTWLQTHAPATAQALRPPAPAAELAAAQERTGVSWPSELQEWFGLHDGWERDAWPSILPGWSSPMSLQRCLDDWRMQQEIWADLAGGDEDVAAQLVDAAGEDAGEMAGVFLPSFVPLDEDQSGDVLFVDCRPGPRQGCVTEWMKENFDSAGVGWWSIGQMFSDVADHLENQTACRFWRPQVVDGVLRWDIDESLGSVSRCLARGSG